MTTSCTHTGCDRRVNLLHFPVPYCRRHTEQRALLNDLARRGRGIGIRDDAWPYGPNIDVPARAAMLDWAERQQLRLSERGDACTGSREGGAPCRCVARTGTGTVGWTT